MDIYTFIDSVVGLDNYFSKCVEVGYGYSGDNYSEIFNSLRQYGLVAEKNMYWATKGINTHKGAIFLFGILCGAIGSLKSQEEDLTLENICYRGGEISKNILDDFKIKTRDNISFTYGQRQYIDYGYYGARGEAYYSFPSIKRAYKTFVDTINSGFSEELALGNSLIELMSFVVDTNIIGRKGKEANSYLNESAKKIKKLGGYLSENGLKEIRNLDEQFIKMNISPGGCADLAAATIFLFWVSRSDSLVKTLD